jgi:uncharacterized protein (TIGR02611 family)
MSPIARTMKQAKRLVILIFGITVICLGIAMIVLPGPAFIVIPLGLAVLATEFVWARKLLHGIKERLPDGLKSRVERAGERFKERFDHLVRKVKEKAGKTRT